MRTRALWRYRWNKRRRALMRITEVFVDENGDTLLDENGVELGDTE